MRFAIEGRHLIACRSSATDAELAEVLARPALFDVDPARQRRLLADWQALATEVQVVESAPWRCRDPLDQKFVDLAVTARAEWLITRDRDLLKLARKARRVGLGIVSQVPGF